MKKLIFALMSVVFLASFTACSTDDDGIVGNNDNTENPVDNNGGGDANFNEFLYDLIQQDGKGRWSKDVNSHIGGVVFDIYLDPMVITFYPEITGSNDQKLTFEVVSNNQIEITGIIFQGNAGTFNYFEVGDIVRITFPSINVDDIPVMTLHNPRVDGEYTGYNHHELYWKASSN